MSSSEPPSRIPPRHQHQDTKAAREEFSHKKKVEKVREVDPDEETRTKFLKHLREEEEKEGKSPKRPSPYDLYQQKPDTHAGRKSSLKGDLAEGLGKEDIVPDPNPSDPPRVDAPPHEEEKNPEDLPHSEDFWDEVDIPQNRNPSSEMKKAPHGKKTEHPSHKKNQEGLSAEHSAMRGEKKRSEKESAKRDMAEKKKKKDDVPTSAPFSPEKKDLERGKDKSSQKEEKSSPRRGSLQGKKSGELEAVSRSVEDPAEDRVLEDKLSEDKPFDNEQKGFGERRGRDFSKSIDSSTLPPLPASIQTQSFAALQQAAPYLSHETHALFYQLVGTMLIAQNQSGIVRTEIVLNNPSFAHSRFFGSTITIEKYQTAPDSFNIRLSGSPEAVAAYKEGIPDLMNAFQNGNFSFRVNRLEAEYASDRPVFRRREKRKESDSGDLGEGRR